MLTVRGPRATAAERPHQGCFDELPRREHSSMASHRALRCGMALAVPSSLRALGVGESQDGDTAPCRCLRPQTRLGHFTRAHQPLSRSRPSSMRVKSAARPSLFSSSP
ncbi:hypothetical protein VTN02DRAFT_5230 [Thermoascus thermophilus]